MTVRIMAEAKNEFTNVTNLRPEAVGEPGNRTFRILADSGSSSAVLWLEKEQLFQLALANEQLLATLAEGQGGSRTLPVDQEAPGLTKLEFKVSKLVLGHNGDTGLFIIDAYDVEDEDDALATVRLWASSGQIKEFAEEALRVCAAGRPLCPLCGRPMDRTGHQCPRLNGHAKDLEL